MDDDNIHRKPRWLTANKQFYRKFKDERDKLKNNMTSAEVILWEHIRNKKLGVKFRRQHIIDYYIPDFVALSIKLIIEVDGKIHRYKSKEDAARAERLESIGFTIIRFTNEKVENDIVGVLAQIKKEITNMTSPDLSKGEE